MSPRLPTLTLGLLAACRSCGESTQEDGGSAGLDAQDAAVFMDNGSDAVTEILENNGGITPEQFDTATQVNTVLSTDQVSPAKQ